MIDRPAPPTVTALPLEAKTAMIREFGRALLAAPSFRALPVDRQRQLGDEVAGLLRYLGDATPLAEAAAGPPPAAPAQPLRPVQPPAQGTIERGTRNFGELVRTVDFPRFVSELVEGVFTSIVDSTIRQMEAYAELVANVTKSVEQFANEHISDDQARDYLQSSFPEALFRDSGTDAGLLALKEGFDGGQMPDFAAFLGEGAPERPEDEPSEAELVRRAKLKMARQRQQQLATMVLLGINRIVVTNGQINAKVVFDVTARETRTSGSTTRRHDERSENASDSASGSVDYTGEASAQDGDDKWSSKLKFGWESKRSQVRTRVSTLDVDTHRQSTEEINAKAQLTGEVKLNFRSETFPLERIADAGGLELLTARAAPEPARPPATKGSGRGTPPTEAR